MKIVPLKTVTEDGWSWSGFNTRERAVEFLDQVREFGYKGFITKGVKPQVGLFAIQWNSAEPEQLRKKYKKKK